MQVIQRRVIDTIGLFVPPIREVEVQHVRVEACGDYIENPESFRIGGPPAVCVCGARSPRSITASGR